MSSSSSENDFVGRLRAGDEAAYRELVARHHAALTALARSVLRNHASAEEVVQETWLAVVVNIGRFEHRSRLSTWIIEILLNKARTRVVRDGRSPNFSDLITTGPDDRDDELDRFSRDGHWSEPVATWDQLDPERIVAGRELWAHVWNALDDLPAAQRAVVVMRDIEDAELPEIGRLLGLSPANVRVLLHRGRHRLRKSIQALLDGTPAQATARGQLKARNAGGSRKSDPHRRRVLYGWPRRILEFVR